METIERATVDGYADCVCCGQTVIGSNMCNHCHQDGSGCNPEACSFDDCDPAAAWHCATGQCDGTVCDDHNGVA